MQDYTQVVLSQKQTTSESKSSTTSKKSQRQKAAQQRQRLAPLTKKLKRLESDIQQNQHDLDTIEQHLADTELYNDEHKNKLQQLLIDQGELLKRKEDLEWDFFAVLEELEQAEAEVS